MTSSTVTLRPPASILANTDRSIGDPIAAIRSPNLRCVHPLRFRSALKRSENTLLGVGSVMSISLHRSVLI
jgi:hypothetical protein